MRWTRYCIALLAMSCLAILGVGVNGVRARHQDEQPRDRALAMFMQAKLDYSKDVLEGLTTADFTKVAQGAQALRQLTEDELWRVNPNINYVRYTEEFVRLADAMEAQANAQNIDGATLSYVNLTINCVNCHKFVRDQRVTHVDTETILR
jgi:cytochrome c556